MVWLGGWRRAVGWSLGLVAGLVSERRHSRPAEGFEQTVQRFGSSPVGGCLAVEFGDHDGGSQIE